MKAEVASFLLFSQRRFRFFSPPQMGLFTLPEILPVKKMFQAPLPPHFPEEILLFPNYRPPFFSQKPLFK